MKTVICTFNLFDLHQQIMVVDDNDTRIAAISSLDSLGEDIAMICDKEDAHFVHLYGSATYAETIKEGIQTANVTKYGCRNLDIKVN